MDLQELRKEIDVVDKQLVELYEKRLEIASSIAMEKINIGKAVYDAKREAEKLDAVEALAKNDDNKLGVRELFEFLMAKSRERQQELMNKKND